MPRPAAMATAVPALTAVPGAEAADAVRRAGAVNALLGLDVTDDTGVPADAFGADRPEPAASLVDAVGEWLGTGERRVAASMVVLGYSARLVGPSVAVLLRDGILPDVRRSRIRFSYAPRRGFRLTWTEPGGWRGEPEALRERWCRDVLEDHLGALIAAVRAVVPVATALLWGNVASGVAGTLRTLGAGPEVGLSIVDAGPLRGSGTWRAGPHGPTFLRRTCCLFYRLDGGGMCGDCPLPARTGAA